MAQKNIETLLKEKKVYEIINSKVVLSNPSISLKQTVELMQSRKSGYVVLTEDQKVVGIFTETDLLNRVLGKDVDWNRPIADFMTPTPTLISHEDSVGTAIDVMAKKDIYHLPLVDKDRQFTGMLSVRTLIRFLSEHYPNEVFNLPPDPSQFSSSVDGG